jgi:RNA polymerase sigma-70 factor (ECF subfamily)
MGREFKELAKEYGSVIFTYARYSLRQREDAEDVTQEVLVRLWANRDAIEPARMRGWVMQVARNLVIDTARRRRTRAAVIADGADADASAAIIASPDTADAALDRGELRDVIDRAIAGLNEPYRSIVVMREIQGLAYDDIATSMSMPLGTIKVYLHRARRVLREAVRREMGTDV